MAQFQVTVCLRIVPPPTCHTTTKPGIGHVPRKCFSWRWRPSRALVPEDSNESLMRRYGRCCGKARTNPTYFVCHQWCVRTVLVGWWFEISLKLLPTGIRWKTTNRSFGWQPVLWVFRTDRELMVGLIYDSLEVRLIFLMLDKILRHPWGSKLG